MQNKKVVLIPVADGSEEIEFSTIFDVVDRCGLEPLLLSVGSSEEVRLAHGLVVRAPHTLSGYAAQKYRGDFSLLAASIDAILLPGGMPGATNLKESKEMQAILSEMRKRHKLIGAICASPAVVLAPLGVMKASCRATCYPAMQDKLKEFDIEWLDNPVVFDRNANILTSQGPGTTAGFALVACSLLVGPDVPLKVNTAMLTNWGTAITNLSAPSREE